MEILPLFPEKEKPRTAAQKNRRKHYPFAEEIQKPCRERIQRPYKECFDPSRGFVCNKSLLRIPIICILKSKSLRKKNFWFTEK